MEDASPRPPPRVDPYQVLSLGKDASAAEVKTAYKKLALKHHPGMLYIDCVKPVFSYQGLLPWGRQSCPKPARHCAHEIPRNRLCLRHPIRPYPT